MDCSCLCLVTAPLWHRSQDISRQQFNHLAACADLGRGRRLPFSLGHLADVFLSSWMISPRLLGLVADTLSLVAQLHLQYPAEQVMFVAPGFWLGNACSDVCTVVLTSISASASSPFKCLTKGQWLQMNIISSTLCRGKSDRATSLPVSGSSSCKSCEGAVNAQKFSRSAVQGYSLRSTKQCRPQSQAPQYRLQALRFQ